MEFPIETTDPILVDLLNNACTNQAWGKNEEDGFSTYRVDLHCVAITYVAKVLERDDGVLPTKYLVICVEYEDC